MPPARRARSSTRSRPTTTPTPSPCSPRNVPRARSRRSDRPVRLLLAAALLPGVAWAAAALWFDGPSSRLLAGGFAAVLALGSAALLVAMRPGRAALIVAAGVVAVAVWWLRIPPSNDRDWLPDVARVATARFQGNRVTIENVRDFEYRTETDYTPHWETRTIDLDRLIGADLFLSFWGPTAIAHTVVSWEF